MWPFDRSKRRFKSLQTQLTHVHEQIDGVNGKIDGTNLRIDEVTRSGFRMEAALEQTLGTGQALQASAASAASALAHLESRVEFVRREILFEIQHGGRGDRAAEDAPVWAVVDQGKYDAGLREGLRLNLGCGHIALPGYVNVDSRALPGVDVVADVSDLKAPAGSVAEIFSSHLLEHFPQERLVRRLLPHWHSLMAEGATFRAVVPDGQAMIDAVGRKEMSYLDFREVLFGAQDYTGDFHFNLFTPDSLGDLLVAAGFHEIEVPARARRNGMCFEFEIQAKA